MDRSRYPTRLCRLGEEPHEPDTRTPAERLASVWTLTLAAWAFMGGGDAESRLRRVVGRVIRGRRRDLADLEELGEIG